MHHSSVVGRRNSARRREHSFCLPPSPACSTQMPGPIHGPGEKPHEALGEGPHVIRWVRRLMSSSGVFEVMEAPLGIGQLQVLDCLRGKGPQTLPSWSWQDWGTLSTTPHSF